MSYMPTTDENLKTTKMTENIATLQRALRQISDARKQLCRNTTEAKSRIQCNISRQLETLRNREVWLLNQLDLVSSAKEEVLQQQSERLNQTLGVLQSTVQFPSNRSDNILRLDLGDVHPEETPYLSFKSDPSSLRDAIMNYGRIDPNSVPPLQSPFMAPGQTAPSLPKQFEDYNDAEHHVLYKTVEEISRTKSSEPCVQVNIPKLSGRIEDWLLYPSGSSSRVSSDPRFTFPQLSNNLSDWLRAPISVTTASKPAPVMTTVKQSTLPPFEGISTDASIKTWLHKIKQNPYEEDEEEYDFVEEMSDTRTQCSLDTLDQFSEEQDNKWLYKAGLPNTYSSKEVLFQIKSLPMEKWLLKSDLAGQRIEEPVMIDMSRYLKKVTDELDQWLLNRSSGKQNDDSGVEVDSGISERLRPDVPSSLDLGWSLGNHLSRVDNPWLQRSRSSTRSSCSFSPVSSRSSSLSGVSSKLCNYNKWLLKGGNSENPSATMSIPYSFMEKFEKDAANVAWLKCDKQNSTPKSDNPLACFASEGFDPSVWLKPHGPVTRTYPDTPSPLKKVLDFQNSSSTSLWLLDPNQKQKSDTPCFDQVLNKGNNKWLHQPFTPFVEDDLIEEELC